MSHIESYDEPHDMVTRFDDHGGFCEGERLLEHLDDIRVCISMIQGKGHCLAYALPLCSELPVTRRHKSDQEKLR